MRRLVVRVTLLGAVLAGGAAAAYLLVAIDRQDRDRAAAQQDAAARLDRLSDAVVGISAAQRAFVAPANLDEGSLERITSQITQIDNEAALLKSRLRSADTAKALDALATAITELNAVNTRARDNLRLGQDAMAADIIADGRSTLDVIGGSLRALRAGERALSQTESTRLARQRWTVLGATAVWWTAGLLLLIPVPPPRAIDADAVRAAEPRQEESKSGLPAPVSAPDRPTTDLTAAAALCTALSRVTTTAALAPLLEKAAALLDAPGIILWMGAGDQLFAVTAYGYGPETVARLGPISRTADNATASAWRTGHIAAVAAPPGGHGAIVTPMFGPDACIGALAIELPRGRERDEATRAVASMVAAQLAAVVPAWPAASAAGEIRSVSA
jgi:hypothetical protein